MKGMISTLQMNILCVLPKHLLSGEFHVCAANRGNAEQEVNQREGQGHRVWEDDTPCARTLDSGIITKLTQ